MVIRISISLCVQIRIQSVVSGDRRYYCRACSLGNALFIFLEYRLSDITVTFCGHSTIYDEGVRDALYKAISDVLFTLSSIDKVTFFCGGYGAFDDLCSTVIDEIRRNGVAPEIEKVFVTPYISESYKDHIDFMRSRYDDVVFPPIESVPKKFAISRRNEWMIDQSDVVIAYVIHSFGGAATTLRYAYRKKKTIVRLISDYDIR